MNMNINLADVFDSLDAAVYIADMKTHEILYVNKYTQDIFGDVVGKKCWSTLQSDQSGPCTFCSNDKLLTPDNQPAGVYHWEFQNTITNRWFDVRDRAIRWPDGRIVRLEIATDITERQQMEITLRDSEKRFRTIIKNSQAIIFMLDRDGVFLESEGISLHALGLKPGQVIGQSALEMYKDYPVVIRSIKDALNGDTVRNSVDVQGVSFDVVYAPYRNADNDIMGVIGMAIDITELKKYGKSLKDRVNELEQFYTMAVNRELKMKKLKDENEKLKSKLSQHEN
jgi:PAS domain S-box-containing protein